MDATITLQPFTLRSANPFFQQAKAKAGIQKEVDFHVLRHSFATHMPDKSTDIRYIKDLPGHFTIKTTERYLHVNKKELVNILSPFDDLWKKKRLTGKISRSDCPNDNLPAGRQV